MTLLTRVFRNLVHYWKQHLLLAAGTALAVAIITGALLLGASVRSSLKEQAAAKTGKADYALLSTVNSFNSELSDKILYNEKDAKAAALLGTGAGLIKNKNGLSLPGIKVWGIDNNINLFTQKTLPVENLKDDEIFINQRVAAKAGLKPGDEILLKFGKISSSVSDVPFGQETELTGSFYRVKSILETAQLSDLSFNMNQTIPLNIFLPLKSLSANLGIPGKANHLMLSLPGNSRPEKILQPYLNMADLGIISRNADSGSLIEILSDQLFFNKSFEKILMKIDPEADRILSYFFNTLSSEGRITPYSIVTASDRFDRQFSLSGNEIILSEWTAADLEAVKGDRVTMAFYRENQTGNVTETASEFIVKEIINASLYHLDNSYMPLFPGLHEVKNCRDWKPGVDINLDLIRKKDEEYWNSYKGTPKAVISLSKAEELFSNRLGSLTAFRFSKDKWKQKDLESAIINNISPGTAGYQWLDLNKTITGAVDNSIDLGGLFLGLSFFLIAAAAILLILLYRHSLTTRMDEWGLLKATGYPNSTIKKLILTEGLLTAMAGGIIGGFSGILYNRFLLFLLSSFFTGTLYAPALTETVSPIAIITGTGCGILLSLGALLLSSSKTVKIPASILLSFKGNRELPESYTPAKRFNKARLFGILFLLSIIPSSAVLVYAFTQTQSGASIWFFLAGTFFLVTLVFLFLFLLNFLLKKKLKNDGFPKLSLFTFGIKNVLRNPGRSTAMVLILAASLFMVTSTGSYRINTPADPFSRDSGTGGFGVYCETTIPVSEKEIVTDTEFVPFRLKPGDDASCLNLQRAVNPSVIGVDWKELSERKAFHFADRGTFNRKDDVWSKLDEQTDGTIPAIADETSLSWNLGNKVGDTIEITDEKGKVVKLRFIASLSPGLLQGFIIISEKNFLSLYPSTSGYRVFLIEAEKKSLIKVKNELTELFADHGAEVLCATERLQQFNAVENTYLSFFLILGGLGVILGLGGFFILIIRQMVESEREFALLTALGFSRAKISQVVLFGNLFLFLSGLMIGTVPSFISMLPVLIGYNPDYPYLFSGFLFICLLLTGLTAIYVIIKFFLKRNFILTLKNE
ncbi:MAG: ABC transporter permease [Spirochaetales bacterium]|nr:ABC transporter permease [Spirochaetales bacterium]